MKSIRTPKSNFSFALRLAMPLTVAAFTFLPSQIARADATSYSNVDVANEANSWVGNTGTNACASDGGDTGSQAKAFVNCVINYLSGGSQKTANGSNDYSGSFLAAGGVEVTQAQAQPGDIIQWGSGADANHHTAIVLVANSGPNYFEVIDSNWSGDGLVQDHTFPNVTHIFASGVEPAPRFFHMASPLTSPPVIGKIVAYSNSMGSAGGQIRLDVKASAANLYSFSVSGGNVSGLPIFGSIASYTGESHVLVTLPPVASLLPTTLDFQVKVDGPHGTTASSTTLAVSAIQNSFFRSTQGNATRFCRRVGSGPLGHVACTTFDGSKFIGTVTSKSLNMGSADTSAVWIPTKKGSDYCRQIGKQSLGYVACTPFTGTEFGPTVQSKALNWGMSGTSQWIPTAAGADYCRQVGSPLTGFVACNTFNGVNFSGTIRSKGLSPGVPGSPVWVPTAAGADYCRQVGSPTTGFVACNTFNGVKFSGTIQSKSLARGSNTAWIPTASGAEYCRQLGADPPSYVACTTFDGAKFGATVSSKNIVWGPSPFESHVGTWLPTTAGVDFCRVTDPQGTNNFITQCTPFNGMKFGPTLQRAFNFGVVIPTSVGADFCDRSTSNVAGSLVCTSFNGVRFGPILVSKPLNFGADGTPQMWIPTTAGADFCRQINTGPSTHLACTTFNGVKFGGSVSSLSLNVGDPVSETWI